MRKTDFPLRFMRAAGRALLACLWLVLVLPAAARAAESAGTILALTGKVEIVRAGATLAATNRAELFSGDTVATGDGQAQIRFTDGGLLTLYRETRFAVDDYRYGKDKDDRARFSLLNGLMHTLTGQMDKQNYQLKTRLANLGVRGTEFTVGLADVLRVSVDQGRVVVSNAGGAVEVGAGQSLTVTGQNKMPNPSTGGKIDVHGMRQGPGGGRPGAGGPLPPGGGTGGVAPQPPPAGTQGIAQLPPKPGDPPLPLPGGQQNPPTGQQTPPTGQQTPPTGQQTPPTGQQTPPTGQQTPPTGQQTPPTGQQTPPTGQQTPPTGQQTPPAGQQIPPVGGGFPPLGPR